METTVSPLVRACRPLDALRVRLLKALGPLARPFIRQRSLRVAAFGLSVVGFSLLATLVCPFWLLALGPILLGTPHLLSDLRYLVFRPGLHRQWRYWLAGALLAVGGTGYYPMEFGLAATAVAAMAATGHWPRKALLLTCIAALFYVVLQVGWISQLVFAHLHNFIAVLLWWLWRPRANWILALAPIAFFLCSAALFWGIVAPGAWAQALAPEALPAASHLSTMAPGLAEPWGLRLVLLFAFAQSVHYGVWLRLIPEDDRLQPTPRPFAGTVRALQADMGTLVLIVAAIIGLGVAIWATLDLAAARNGYLRLALFHGYLELAALAILFVEWPQRKAMAAKLAPIAPTSPVPSAS